MDFLPKIKPPEQDYEEYWRISVVSSDTPRQYIVCVRACASVRVCCLCVWREKEQASEQESVLVMRGLMVGGGEAFKLIDVFVSVTGMPRGGGM